MELSAREARRLASSPMAGFDTLKTALGQMDEGELEHLLRALSSLFREGQLEREVIELMGLLHDMRYASPVKRSRRVTMIREALYSLLSFRREVPSAAYITIKKGDALPSPEGGARTLCINAEAYPSEGIDSLASEVVRAYVAGWRSLLLYDVRGQRFIGSGLGKGSHGLVLHVYGSPGDYLASGLWGARIICHDSAQDQVANIMKDGELIVYGDAGQALLYAAKGGEVYIMGKVAGRPYIFTVGSPRLIINETALDYLGEQCMAGDALNGGGFVIVNGVELAQDGSLRELEEPYPGSNLFSLASGGAVYIRDPYRRVGQDQLNEGIITELRAQDWEMILPYLRRNERLFGISLDALLTVDGRERSYREVYIKVMPNPKSEKLKATRH